MSPRSIRGREAIRWLWIMVLMACACAARGQVVKESFETNPGSAGRFAELTVGTETRFAHDPVARNLSAILDVDFSPAHYLSAPFSSITDAVDSSFSVRLRVAELDDRSRPTGFIGLMTDQHVEAFGDGVTMVLSTLDGGVVANANLDAGEYRAAGGTVSLERGREYLAVGRYKAASRRFTVELFDGAAFDRLVGFSSVTLPPDRHFQVNRIGLQNGGGRDIDRDTGSITLTVDDLFVPGNNPNRLSIVDGSGREGDAVPGVALFGVTVTPASSQVVTVQFETSDGTARAGIDYVATSGTLTIPPGARTAEIRVPLIGDRIDEGDETFQVRLVSATDATIERSAATGTIQDDDPQPTARIEDLEILEGDPPQSPVADFKVELSTASALPVRMAYETINGTAVDGSDYRGTGGVLEFAPGEVTKLIRVPIIADLAPESPRESLTVALSALVNALPGRVTATGTILDDDSERLLSVDDGLIMEGQAGLSDLTFTVSLNRAHSVPVSVTYAVAGATATGNVDFQPRSGQLTFAPGVTRLTVAVPVVGDLLPESDETFTLLLSNPVNAGIGKGRGVGTIQNDDVFPQIRIADTSVREGSDAPATMLFTAALDRPVPYPTEVRFRTVSGTAGEGLDYVSTAGTLSFGANEVTRTIGVPINADRLSEADETLFVVLEEPVSVRIERGQAEGRILDDDPEPGLSVNDVTVTESDSGTVVAEFAVSLSAPSGRVVTVSYATIDGTARAPSDYSSTLGLLTFPVGSTAQTIAVPIQGDRVREAREETFQLQLTNPRGATLSDAQGIGTIFDTDPVPTLSVADIRVAERAGGAEAIFQLLLSNPTFETVAVDFATIDGSATAAADFTDRSGRITFAPGNPQAEIRVPIRDDQADEPDETFVLTLANLVGATLADSAAIGTIVDDDPAPSVSIQDRALAEGDSGTTSFVLTATLSSPSAFPVSVDWATGDGTASAGSDYQASRGTLAFPPGAASATFTVPVNGDLTVEPDETFRVALSNPINASVGDGEALGTIRDDDARLITINDVEVPEGKQGTTTPLTFTVSLSGPAKQVVTATFTTEDGTARAPSDYLSASGSITFAIGESTKTIGVTVIGDDNLEPDEDFFVVLSNVAGAGVGKPRGRGTILNDDMECLIVAGASQILAEDCQPVNGAVDPGEWVSMNLGLANRGNRECSSVTATLEATTGVEPDPDAAPQSYGVLSAGGAEVLRPFRFRATGECGGAVSPTLKLRFADGTLATARFSVPLGRRQDGVAICCRMTDLTLSVADSPDPVLIGTPLTYRAVVTNAGSDQPTLATLIHTLPVDALFVSVTSDRGACSVVNGVLRCEVGSLAPGATANVVLTVTPRRAGNLIANFGVRGTEGDPRPENNNATVVTAVQLPTGISASDVTVVEGNDGVKEAVFTLRLSPPTGRTVTVAAATQGGSASPGEDYRDLIQVVTFPPGTDAATVRVPILGDRVDEPDETFVLRLTDPVNAPLAAGFDRATGTITDDDEPCLIVGDATVGEPGEGAVEAIFPVRLSSPAIAPVSVDFATAGGTATAGSDFEPRTGRVSFPAGVTTTNITVRILADKAVEASETFGLQLRNAAGAGICDGDAIGTILDAVPPPALSVARAEAREGDGGFTDMIFTISLSRPVPVPVSVACSTVAGTATAGVDFVARASEVVTIPPGETTGRVVIPVIGDLTVEANETLELVLANPVNASIGTDRATGTIIDDDYPAVISMEGYRLVSEGCRPANGAADPSEAVTFEVVLANRGVGPTRNLTATLLTGPVVSSASPTQSYGVIAANGTSQGLPFSFQVAAGCGETVPIRFQLNDGGQSLGIVSFPLPLGAVRDGRAQCCTGTDVAVKVVTPGTTVELGREFTYRVAVLNQGPSRATGITLTNSAAANLKIVSVTSPSGDYQVDRNLIRFRMGDLEPGGSVEAEIRVASTALGPAAIIATGAAAGEDATPADNTSVAVVTVVNEIDLSIEDAEVAESSSGAVANFVVHLEPVRARTVTVNFATRDGTAIAGRDYVSASGTVTFPAGTTQVRIPVTILDDRADEAPETFSVVLSDPVGAALGVKNVATGRIVDNDPPEISVDDVAVNVGVSGSAVAVLTVSLGSPAGQPVSVRYTSDDGTATVGTDYDLTTGVLTIPAGATNALVEVRIKGNTQDESTEHFWLRLSEPVNASLAKADGKVTITDEDPADVTIENASLREGDSGSRDLSIPVRLSKPILHKVVVEYSTSDGTASAGSDYLSVSGLVEFPPGSSLATIAVPILGDRVPEPDEVFRVRLRPRQNAVLRRAEADGTIVNDDASQFPPTVSLTAPADGAVFEAPGSILIRAAASDVDGTVTKVQLVGGGVGLSEMGQPPYEFLWQNVPAGTYSLVARATDNDGLAAESAPVRITVVEKPSVSIQDVTVVEGNRGTTPARLVARLSAPASRAVSVRFSTRAGTALAGSDFDATTGSVSIPIGQVESAIEVPVRGDEVYESDEAFTVELSELDGVRPGRLQAGVSITNDDRLPTIEIADVTVSEPDFGTADAVVTVRLSGATALPVRLDYATVPASATRGTDFLDASGSIDWPDGFPGSVADAPVLRAAVTPGRIELRWTDDSGAFVLEESDAVARGWVKSGLTVMRQGNEWSAIADSGTGKSRFFRLARNGSGSVGPSSTAVVDSRVVRVPIVGDVMAEPEENLLLRLANVQGAQWLPKDVRIAIVDNDSFPSITLSGGSVREGDSGTAPLVFVARLSKPYPVGVSVDYTSFDITARADSDYQPISGTVTFSPGSVEERISVFVVGDRAIEGDETLGLRLSRPVNISGALPEAIGTVVDDDLPRLSVEDTSVVEGDSGTLNAQVTVRLSAVARGPVSVQFRTVDGTALRVGDYLERSGLLTLAQGETSKTVEVAVVGDRVAEPLEEFFIELSSPVGATLERPRGRIGIADNDGRNLPPVVRLTTPENDDVFPAGTVVLLAADASDPDGTVAKVDFFANDQFVGTALRAPFVVHLADAAPGRYVLRARATDDLGATGDSDTVTFTVRAGDGRKRVAIVQNRPDPEITRLQAWLTDLDLTSRVFNQEGLTATALEGYDLVIWDDLGDPGLTDNEVGIFTQVLARDVPLYFIGDDLVENALTLSTRQRSEWAALVHLRPGGSEVTEQQVDILERHPVTNGPFGLVGDFELGADFDPALPTGTGELLLGQSGLTPVLVSAENGGSATRTVSQGFLGFNGAGLYSQLQREKLFKNAVWWLLRLPPPPPFLNLSLDLAAEPPQAAINQSVTLTATVQHGGELEATGVVLAVLLPEGVIYEGVEGDAVTTVVDGRTILCNLGRLSGSQTKSVALTVRVGVAGPVSITASVSPNQAEAVTEDNTVQISIAP